MVVHHKNVWISAQLLISTVGVIYPDTVKFLYTVFIGPILSAMQGVGSNLLDNRHTAQYLPIMAKLGELLAEYQYIERELEDSGGEISGDLEERLNALEGDLAGKVDYLAYLCERAPAAAQFYRDQANKYLKMAKALEGLETRVKDNVRFGMENTGQAEILGKEFEFRLQKPRTSVEIIDDGDIPIELCNEKTVYKADKARIKESIQAGKEVPGARLIHKSPIAVRPRKKYPSLD